MIFSPALPQELVAMATVNDLLSKSSVDDCQKIIISLVKIS